MKNITVSVDDETYRKARVYAAEKDTSVSALVKDMLQKLPSEKRKGAVTEAEFDRLAKQEQELRKQLGYFSASDRMTRDEVYDRSRK
jgi:plasmid stability protein